MLRLRSAALAAALVLVASVAGACSGKSSSSSGGDGGGDDSGAPAPADCVPRCEAFHQLCPNAGVECDTSCSIANETQLECLEAAAQHACNTEEMRACRSSSGGGADGGDAGAAACVGTAFGPCATSDQCGAGNHCALGCCYSSAGGNPCGLSTDCASSECAKGICS